MQGKYQPLIAGALAIMLAVPAWSAPPEGKGKPEHFKSESGHPGKGKPDHKKFERDHGYRENSGSPGKQDSQAGRDHGRPPRDLATVGITASQTRLWAREYHLGGYKPLPPGIAKNLARGKPLPPGIAKQTVPASLLGRLPHYDGHQWYVVGRDLVLVSLTGLIVANILDNVFD